MRMDCSPVVVQQGGVCVVKLSAPAAAHLLGGGVRQISHNLLKRETSFKVGIQGKRLQAGWRDDYLLRVLRS